MNYGLSRAVPMGILGFALGMLLTIILRAWQALDPVWDPEVGIVLGGIVSAVLFVWSMGAFDPQMSAHGEEHDEEHAEELAVHTAHTAEPQVTFTEALQNAIKRVSKFPQSGGVLAQVVKWILAAVALLALGLALLVTNVLSYMRKISGDVFFVTTATLILLLGLIAVALWSGFFVPITNDPVGSAIGNGFITINIFETDVVFTKLTLFLIFIVWTILSLVIAGGAISLLIAFLSRETRAVKGKAPAPEALIPPAPLRLLSRGATWLLNRLPEPPKPQR
jgi:hypothetical protein